MFRATQGTNSQHAEPGLKPNLESLEPKHRSYEMDAGQQARPGYLPYQDGQAGVHEPNASYWWNLGLDCEAKRFVLTLLLQWLRV